MDRISSPTTPVRAALRGSFKRIAHDREGCDRREADQFAKMLGDPLSCQTNAPTLCLRRSDGTMTGRCRGEGQRGRNAIPHKRH